MNWHLLIYSDHLRPGKGSLGFEHSRISFIFQALKRTVERGLKKTQEKCKEGLELSSP